MGQYVSLRVSSGLASRQHLYYAGVCMLNKEVEYKGKGPAGSWKSWRAGNTENGKHKEAFINHYYTCYI